MLRDVDAINIPEIAKKFYASQGPIAKHSQN